MRADLLVRPHMGRMQRSVDRLSQSAHECAFRGRGQSRPRGLQWIACLLIERLLVRVQSREPPKTAGKRRPDLRFLDSEFLFGKRCGIP